MKLKNLLMVVIAVVVVLLLGSTIYTVHETQRAIVLRFNANSRRSDIQPGIHWKIPFADEVRKFDGRVLTVQVPVQRYLTVQQDPLRVNSFAKWRIADVGQFYIRNAGDDGSRASSRLAGARQRGAAQRDQPPYSARRHLRRTGPADGGSDRAAERGDDRGDGRRGHRRPGQADRPADRSGGGRCSSA